MQIRLAASLNILYLFLLFQNTVIKLLLFIQKPPLKASCKKCHNYANFLNKTNTYFLNNLFDFQGDVQMAVSALIVLGDRIRDKISLEVQEQWYMSYIGEFLQNFTVVIILEQRDGTSQSLVSWADNSKNLPVSQTENVSRQASLMAYLPAPGQVGECQDSSSLFCSPGPHEVSINRITF